MDPRRYCPVCATPLIVREIADDLGLTGPFEANAPVSLEHGESAVPATAAAGS